MKKFSFVFALLITGAAGYSQTLITLGNSTVDKSEFLRAYNRNKTTVTDKEKALREYLELYTNFKLKVKAAQEARIDTVAQVKYDTENFRDQVSSNYLSNDNAVQLLTDEAIQRAQKDLHVIYFIVPVAPNAPAADKEKASAAAKEIYSQLKAGNSNYAELVTAVSAKNAPAKYADLGFVTAFSLPYEYESIVYKTAPGNISEPYAGPKGWVVLKTLESRPDVGKWKAAQIMLAYPPDADYNTKLAIKERADSVYFLVKNGLAFDSAAKKYSDDRTTYMIGGELPEFSTGHYTDVFEKNTFALQKDGEISKPFETAFGYHIVKRLSQTIPDKNDANYKFDMKQRVMQDARINSEKEQFAKEIRVKTGFKRNPAVSDAELLRYADSVKNNTVTYNIDKSPIAKKQIASFKDGTSITGAEWLKNIKEYTVNTEVKTGTTKELWEQYVSQSVLNYYKKHLDEYNTDFKYQMQEFREGNMLFEVMERNVWSKAGADSAALLNYYNAHKTNYKWEPSADVIIINAANEAKAADALLKLQAGKTWQSIAEESNNTIQADSGRYELSQLAGAPASAKEGTYSAIIKNTDGTAVVIKYVHTYPADMQRTFAEARGLVINDYQTVLEKKWVDQLRNKYPVKVNEAVFNEMLK